MFINQPLIIYSAICSCLDSDGIFRIYAVHLSTLDLNENNHPAAVYTLHHVTHVFLVIVSRSDFT